MNTNKILFLKAVESSNIYGVRYSESEKTLYICFKSPQGRPMGVYRYFDIPKGIYLEFMNAASIGSYFSRQIRNAYTHERLDWEVRLGMDKNWSISPEMDLSQFILISDAAIDFYGYAF